MVKHQSDLNNPNLTTLSSIGNDWHKCERFWIQGKPCPFQTADIEQDEDDQPPESKRSPIPLISPPARSRRLRANIADVAVDAQTFDIRDFVNLPTPEPVLPEGPRPDRPIPGPNPGLPRPKVPRPLNIDRLPDGMPIINPGPLQNVDPANIGRLIQWLNSQFITGLANKPAFSLSPQAIPSVRNSRMPAQQLDAFLLQESALQAASAEANFASQSASLIKPVSDIERDINQSSSRSTPNRPRVTGRQIVGAGAAIAAGAAGALAVGGGRRGGGGGLHFPSRFPRDPAMAR